MVPEGTLRPWRPMLAYPVLPGRHPRL